MEPNEITYMAMEEAMRDENLSGPYDSVEELMKALTDDSEIRLSKRSEIFSGSFRHKTLRERIEESGMPLTLEDEYDWGEPQGDEMW